MRWKSSSGDATWLDIPAFRAMFAEEWRDLSVSFLKIEAAPVFVEDGDDSFETFVAGDLLTSNRLVQERVLRQREMYADLLRKNGTIVRLRVVGRPVTPYIAEYESAAYEIVPSIGEAVRYIDEGALPAHLQDFYRDMLIFDQNAVLVHEYTPWGRLLGGWHSRDPAVVNRCWSAWHELDAVSREFLDKEAS